MTLINTNQRKAGIVLVVASAIVFSSAGVFTNGVSTDAWGVIFWRGVAAAAFTLIYLVLRGALLAEIRAFNKPAFFVTLMMAAGTAAFIPAFKLSSVANVALIYATAPFIAAGLSWIFIKEPPTTRVILASLAALGGVFVIVSASFGGSQLTGDFLALFMTLMMSGIMVVYRKFPSTTAALPAALSSIVLLPFALAYGDPFAVQSHELPILIAFGLVFAVASVTLSEGARRLPSAETALLSTLEMPLAPVLAFLVLSEVPTSPAIIGGSIIFLAVVWSQKRNA
ncbi:DMT family transporter [Sulfitobacter sp. CW3]|uniref:DMT family transporter n=1 Tax=Sulfitobacter sp. CW3 TaxID=2861965 RepID=UPI001C5D4111|nr:DMT family transporter [Sulfitobacter sp. CW3]MBW4964275.1 DMT family transporter [Sulfitobacter sp. CW3]